MSSNREAAMKLLQNLLDQTKEHPELKGFLRDQIATNLKEMIDEVKEPHTDNMSFRVEFFGKEYIGTGAGDIAQKIMKEEFKDIQ